jgi:hypothetical protein
MFNDILYFEPNSRVFMYKKTKIVLAYFNITELPHNGKSKEITKEFYEDIRSVI